MITPEQIDQWRSVSSEHQRLEFKEAKTNYDHKKICKYCVAIANEGGGHFLLGITDAPPRQVVGTSAVRNPIKQAQQLLQKLGFRVDVTAVNHPDGRVVVFSIPSRPKGLAYHLEGTYLMRSGEELVPMSQDRLRSIFAEGEPDWLEEASRTDLNADKVVELLDTQTFFELLHLPYPTTQQGVLHRLIQERLVDSVNGSYSIRRLGGILLAKRLQDFPDLSRKAPRVVVYSGASKRKVQIDKQESKGYAVGFQELVDFVMSQLPRNEVIHDALRKDVTLAPEIAIRELLANSLIHQDFNISGASMMVEIYNNRVEISNPGVPIVPVERFIDGYQSRNEWLADLMRRMRICEERSSGIDKVIEAAEFSQLPAPDFRIAHQRTVAIVFGQKDFKIMKRNDRIRACYQHCVLKYVMEERMTNQSLRKRFHLPESKSTSVSQVIALTIDANQIKLDETVGASRKFACYLPFWA